MNSPTPDDVMFRQLALTYASNHPTMRTGHNCDETFPSGIISISFMIIIKSLSSFIFTILLGITNGAFWYELNGMSIQSLSFDP